MMTYKEQPMIDYGFTDLYGHEWCNKHVDSYNNYTKQMNKNAGKIIQSGSLTGFEMDGLLDRRNQYFKMVSGH